MKSLKLFLFLSTVLILSQLLKVSVTVAQTTTTTTEPTTTTTISPTCGISANDKYFGSVDPGEISSEQTITVTNTGDTQTTSLTIKGTDWNPYMPVGQTSWKLSGETYAQLTTSEVSLGQQVGPSSPLDVYFQLTVPAQTPANSYTQTITFTSSC